MTTVPFKNIKLFKPEDFKKEDYHGKACFSYEYQKYGFFENWKLALSNLQNLPDKHKLFCELIPDKSQVKPYFDIEWYEHEFDYDNSEVLFSLTKSLIKIIKNQWKINIQNKDIYVSQCHRETRKGYKNSFHIIISPDESIIFNEASDCLFLAKLLQEEIKQQFDPRIIDLNVYKRKQQFRMIGHSKKDEATVLQKIDRGKQGEDVHFMVTYITPIFRILDCPEQQTSSELISIRTAKVIIMDDTEIIVKITEMLKAIHPSVYFTDRIDQNNFLFFNYTDRTEPCFSEQNRTHQNLGFWVFVKETGQVYIGCYSSNCRDENNKAITRLVGDLREPEPHEKKFIPVTYDEDLFINTNLVQREIFRDAIGLSNMFNNAYLGNIKRIKWVDSGNGKDGTTYFWNGKIWKEDSFNFLFRLISEKLPESIQRLINDKKGGNDNVDDLSSQMSFESDTSKEIKYYKSIMTKLFSGSINRNIINFVKPSMYDPYFDKIKDSHPGKLAVFNGIVDLSNSSIRPSEPTDNITRTLELGYFPETFGKNSLNYQIFDDFIHDITRNKSGEKNEEMYNFMKWILGYAIQGKPKKKLFFIFWGPEGYNGKSLLLNTISSVLEDYAVTMDKSVVLEAPKKTAGSASSELMRLENCRFGILGDTKEGSAIDDGQVKGLTSITDKISARELFGKQKEFLPTFVALIATNHKIRVNLSDPAMYDRLILYPFWVKFLSEPNPDNPRHRKSDLELPEKFAEQDFKKSILCWLIDSGKFYHDNQNLKIPQEIITEKDKYREEMNIYLEFIQQECEKPIEANLLTEENKTKYVIAKTEFIDSFINYCIRNGIKIAPNKAEKDVDKYIPIIKIEKINYYYNIKWKENK